jgi:hypothetical protein
MAFPTTPILDDFDRADEGPPPSSSWTNYSFGYTGGLCIVSNQCVASVDGGVPRASYWSTPFNANCEVYFTLDNLRSPIDNTKNLYIRFNPTTGVSYQLQIFALSTGTELALIVNRPVQLILGTYSTTLSTGDRFGLRAIGSTISVWYAPVATGIWSEVITANDSNVTAGGNLMVCMNSAGPSQDAIRDFGGGDYIAPPNGYSIITPDGVTVNLSAAGLGVNPGIPDGFGLAPITHRTSKLYRSAGALLNGIDIEPRIVTITISAIAASQEALHAVRAGLWAALRWNRTLTDPPPPSRLRYTANGKTADLYVHYLSDVQGNAGNAQNLQLIGVRLIAYDPMWYAVTPITDTLDFVDSAATQGFMGRNSLAWSNCGLTWTDSDFLAVAVSNDGNTVYLGGGFTDINHVGINRIVSYDRTTGTWSAMGTGFDNAVRALAVAPNGDVYAGGSFTTADGGAAMHVAMWDGAAWNACGAGTDGDVYAIAIDRNGIVYVGGGFSNAGGAPASGVAAWDPVNTAWSPLDAGTGINVYALAVGADGMLYAGGSFAALLYIAQWDGAAWSTVGAGFNGQVNGLAIGKNGLLYATGIFTALDTGEPVAYVAMWNGANWSALDSGFDDWGYTVAVTDDGSVYVGGQFTTAGGLALADSVAVWNGSMWSQLDIDLPGVAIVYALAAYGNDLFMAHEYIPPGTVYFSALNILTTIGDAESFPIITITGPGTLQFIINHTSGEQLVFNLFINPGEVITIDLSPGVKSITSSWPGRPGNAVGLVLPASDLGVWSLKPAPAAVGGDNIVSVYMTDTTGDTDCAIEYYDRWLSADEACK